MDRKEAIEIVRDNWPEGRVLLKSALEVLIPELRESEDKRIREWLIKGMKYLSEESSFFRDIPKDKVIAWLEKQGKIAEHYEDKLDRCTCDSFDKGYRAAIENLDKQNPGLGEDGDKAETKFKAGDWVVKGDVVAQILYEQKYAFVGLDTKGNYFVCNYGHVDSIRPWTIQDAKDGDVLAIDWKDERHWQKIVIFKSLNEFGVEGYGNTFVNNEIAFKENVPFYSKTWTKYLYPATKEQCNLLFSKMKEAGYEWDAEKKELKRVEPKFKVGDCIRHKDADECYRIVAINDNYYFCENNHAWNISSQDYFELVEPKSGWSEEDEKYFNLIYKELNYYITNKRHWTPLSVADLSWLKSLKERLKKSEV